MLPVTRMCIIPNINNIETLADSQGTGKSPPRDQKRTPLSYLSKLKRDSVGAESIGPQAGD